MRIILMVSILLATQPAYSADQLLCPKSHSRGEGHWPIPEHKFDKSGAEKALKIIAGLVRDGINPAVDNLFENEFMMVRGYVLKLYAERGSNIDLRLFCDFMKNEAYVRH